MKLHCKLHALLLSAFCIMVSGCTKDSGGGSSSVKERSYSVCTVKVQCSLDVFNQVDYKFDGYGMGNYSYSTVCFRRVMTSGYTRGYNEIKDSRSNPNLYQTYHTYKKLQLDETGVVLRWLELTDKDTGEVTRYINY